MVQVRIAGRGEARKEPQKKIVMKASSLKKRILDDRDGSQVNGLPKLGSPKQLKEDSCAITNKIQRDLVAMSIKPELHTSKSQQECAARQQLRTNLRPVPKISNLKSA